MSAVDDVAYAIKISEAGAARMCAAAGIQPPEWQDREWAEIDVHRQTRSLARRGLDEIISQDEVISRRPYLCAVCGGTFTTEQFDQVRTMSRERHDVRPFDTAQPVHEECRS